MIVEARSTVSRGRFFLSFGGLIPVSCGIFIYIYIGESPSYSVVIIEGERKESVIPRCGFLSRDLGDRSSSVLERCVAGFVLE